jgi:hypothetical protein
VEKANWAIWRTDYYICTENTFIKSIGKTPSDFAVLLVNSHSWAGIKGQGLKPAVQVLFGLIKLYENSTFQITSESDTLR